MSSAGIQIASDPGVSLRRLEEDARHPSRRRLPRYQDPAGLEKQISEQAKESSPRWRLSRMLRCSSPPSRPMRSPASRSA